MYGYLRVCRAMWGTVCRAMCMLRDPGVGTGKSVSWSERARKKFGQRKVKKERKTPWGQCFNGPGNLDDGYKYYFVFYYYSS